jgi:Gram-negative bacterial TonB protein C-terminal
MVNSVSNAQATALEISVTIQGSKPVDGTERRELFTETTKTTLVFEIGAVVNLNSRVSLGQCVFLRNNQSGKEILCKVLTWRQVGQSGYADLEFTASDPEFWAVPAGQNAATGQKPEAPTAIEAPGERQVTAPSMGCGAPTSRQMPSNSLETAATPLTRPSPLATETLLQPATGAEWGDAKGVEIPRVPIPEDANPKPEQACPAPRIIEIERAVESTEVPESGETDRDAASEAREFPTQVSQTPVPSNSNSEKNPIAIGIAASVLLAAVLGGAWYLRHGSTTHHSDQPPAASAQTKQDSLHALAQPAQSLSSGVARVGSTTAGPVLMNAGSSSVTAEVRAQSSSGGSTPVQVVQKTQEATVSAEDGDDVAQHPPATTEADRDVREGNSAVDSSTSAITKVGSTRSTPNSDAAASAQPEVQSSIEPNTTLIIPAKIVSKSLPSIPTWARGLDTDPVVQLDALIDEKGNITQTKPLSGPRALQRVAEQAVALWIFEPALSDGKPTATHLVLTVQFQR